MWLTWYYPTGIMTRYVTVMTLHMQQAYWQDFWLSWHYPCNRHNDKIYGCHDTTQQAYWQDMWLSWHYPTGIWQEQVELKSSAVACSGESVTSKIRQSLLSPSWHLGQCSTLILWFPWRQCTFQGKSSTHVR